MGQRRPPWGGEPGTETAMQLELSCEGTGRECQAGGTASAKVPKPEGAGCISGTDRPMWRPAVRDTGTGTAVLGILQKLSRVAALE